jgi:hypothetical protein
MHICYGGVELLAQILVMVRENNYRFGDQLQRHCEQTLGNYVRCGTEITSNSHTSDIAMVDNICDIIGRCYYDGIGAKDDKKHGNGGIKVYFKERQIRDHQSVMDGAHMRLALLMVFSHYRSNG